MPKYNPNPPKNPAQKKVQEEPEINFEKESRKEISEVHRKLRAATQGEKDHKDRVTSTGFWFAVYFADEEQAQEFIKNAGLTGSNNGQYFNGEKFAKVLGVPLKKKKLDPPKAFRMHKNLKHFN